MKYLSSYYFIIILKMKKDYSKLFRSKYDEKEIEEKYSQFLDWLVENIDNDIYINKPGIPGPCKFIPTEFNEILHQYNKHADDAYGQQGLVIKRDINEYLNHRNIKIHSYLIGGELRDELKNRKIGVFFDGNYDPYRFNIGSVVYQQKVDIKKQLVDKFKEEAMINKPITSFPDEIHDLQNRIRILEKIIIEII